MKITFTTSTQDDLKLKLVSNICTLVSKHIQLPNHIEVEFKKMGMSSYGETIVDPRRVIKRIVLSTLK